MYEFTTTAKGWKIHWGVSAKSNPKAAPARTQNEARRFNPEAPRRVAVQPFIQKETGAPKAWPFVF